METFTGSITIQQILLYNDNWLNFIKLYKDQIRDVVFENINKILNCRKGLGYSLYVCPICDKQERVMHSCKSRICSSCGKAAQDKWLSKTLSKMLPVSYKHIIFTIPEQLRKLFLTHRNEMLNVLFKVSAKAITNIAEKFYKFTPGIIAVSHSFGNDLKSNFHMHLIVSSGGLSTSANKWINQSYIPERYFHQIRYYGLFANRTKSSNIKKALKLLGRILPFPKLFNNFRQRFMASFGFDRLFCKKCNRNMVFSGLYLPP